MSPTGCPICNHRLSQQTTVQGGVCEPKCNDVAVCRYCGSLLTYTAAGEFRVLTDEQVAQLPPEILSELLQARLLAGKLRSQAGRKPNVSRRYVMNPDLTEEVKRKALELRSMEAKLITWCAVHGSLQLALRHPEYIGASRPYVEEFVERLGEMLVQQGFLTTDTHAKKKS